jgi:hypothetical protein
MLPGEIVWLSTIAGSVLSYFALIRHERSKALSWCTLLLNGSVAVFLGAVWMMKIK